MIELTITEEDKQKAIQQYINEGNHLMCQTCLIAQCLKRNNITFEFVQPHRVVNVNGNAMYNLDGRGMFLTFMPSSDWHTVVTPYTFGLKEPHETTQQTQI